VCIYGKFQEDPDYIDVKIPISFNSLDLWRGRRQRASIMNSRLFGPSFVINTQCNPTFSKRWGFGIFSYVHVGTEEKTMGLNVIYTLY